MKKIYFLLLLMPFSGTGQVSDNLKHLTDSLESVVNGNNNDTLKVQALKAWDDLIYRSNPRLDVELNRKIDSVCTKNLALNISERERFIYQSCHAFALNNLGIISYAQARFNQALEYYQRSLQVKEALGDINGKGSTLFNMGNANFRLGNYTDALNYCQQGLYKKFGNVKEIANCYNTIAAIYEILGQYDSAIVYQRRTMEIYKQKKDLRGIGTSMVNTGNIYISQGNLRMAIDLYQKSIPILQQLGDTVFLATTLHNIGAVYQKEGDLRSAIRYYEEALDLNLAKENKSGIAFCMLNLGIIYSEQRNEDKAIEFTKKALATYEETGQRREIAQSFANLGIMYRQKGDYSRSLEEILNSIKMQEEIGDKRSLATTIDNLAATYGDMGEINKAIASFSKSLEISRAIKDKYGSATSLNGLADCYRLVRNIDLSEEFSREVLKIAEQIGLLREKATASNNLFKTSASRNDWDAANGYLNDLLAYRQRELFNNFSIMTEKEKELYFTIIEKDYDLLYDFTAWNLSDHPEQAGRAYTIALMTKGLLLKSSTLMRNTILNSGDTLLIKKYDDWIALKRRITIAYAEGGETSEMEKQADKLESELVRNSLELDQIKKVQELTWKDVQANLKEGESAVEFIRYSHRKDFINDSDIVKQYAALIIDSKCRYPKMVPLFEESKLEQILGTFPGNNLSYIQQVYGSNQNAKSQLYDLIWKPIEKEVGQSKKVYISPVGLLHKISFSALAKEQDVYLCDLLQLEIQSSTGKVVFGDIGDLKPNSSITLFGGINYNSDSTSMEMWSYLDGTKVEIEAIFDELQKKKRNVFTYFHNEASEEKFKETAPKSNVVHIATHGFFYSDPDDIDEEEIRDGGLQSEKDLAFRGGKSGFGVRSFVENRNPLMRSGLVLAGANDVWSRIQDTDIEGNYREDGVLTAQEVATMDMRKTDLIVLSACETGLGDIKGSEGVYGLQRAFKMAGVNSIIMSLWQVPDKETSEFMTTFYKHLIKANDIRNSFNLTQQEMRKKYDPYYWAAFVLVE